jgi:hypothetical protein
MSHVKIFENFEKINEYIRTYVFYGNSIISRIGYWTKKECKKFLNSLLICNTVNCRELPFNFDKEFSSDFLEGRHTREIIWEVNQINMREIKYKYVN